MKKRLIAVFLSMAMLLTFMPTMAFAGDLPDETDAEWSIYDPVDPFQINFGEATLYASLVDYEGEETPEYEWFKDYGNYYEYYDESEADWESLGETEESITVDSHGWYACAVTIGDDIRVQKYYVCEEEFDWEFVDDDCDYEIKQGQSVTLSGKTTYSGDETPTYQWYTFDVFWDDDNDELVEEKDEISEATGETLVVDDVGIYICEVTIDGQTQEKRYYVSWNTDDYEYICLHPEATAKYQTVDNRTLIIDYENGNNFPQEGDSIVVTYKGGAVTYICSYVDLEDGDFYFINPDDEDDSLEIYWDRDWDVDANKGTVKISLETPSEYDHTNKTVTQKFNIEMTVKAIVRTDVASIKYNPSTITLYSEDIKKKEADGSYSYSFENRGKYIDEDGDIRDTFALPGDTITVTYKNGNSVVYKYNAKTDEFIADNEDTIWLYAEDPTLRPGDNTIKLWRDGMFATVKVFMDTPELRAQRANAEAAAKKAADELKEWNGTVSNKVPAVKKAKFKASKKKVIVSWTKANKKNLKKFDTVEIQVCNNKKFQKSNTKRVIVKKSKKKAEVKKLKKGTYYVRVRNVKGSGPNKLVSKWSKVKKVKVK